MKNKFKIAVTGNNPGSLVYIRERLEQEGFHYTFLKECNLDGEAELSVYVIGRPQRVVKLIKFISNILKKGE